MTMKPTQQAPRPGELRGNSPSAFHCPHSVMERRRTSGTLRRGATRRGLHPRPKNGRRRSHGAAVGPRPHCYGWTLYGADLTLDMGHPFGSMFYATTRTAACSGSG